MGKEIEIKKKKRKLSIYYGLLVTVVCIIGVSFAWFRLYLSQTENNTIASRTCFNTTLTEDTSKISLTDAFPITDEDGLKQIPFTFTIKNNCNSYVKVYITIDSTYRESTDSSYLKDNYMKVNISPKGTITGKSVILGSQTLTDLENNRKGYIVVNTGLKANEEKSYDLRIWMDNSVTTEQGLNKNWSGKIVVVSNASNEPTFAETILANNEVKVPLTTPGKEVSAYTKDDIADTSTESVSSTYQDYYFTYGTGYEANGTNFNLTGAAVTSDTYANSYSSLVGKYLPASSYIFSYSDFSSKTSGKMSTTSGVRHLYYIVSATSNSFVYKDITSNKNTTEALLASAEDDYGTSYYFRGAVKNNYVEFANKCWRIVRINGDGSIKLVLYNDNTGSSSSPCSSSNNSKTAAFAKFSGDTYRTEFNSVNNVDNISVGFMYGTAGASDYATTHANTNKSTILTNLETWYTNNLASYESKLADTIWCNDKSGGSYGENPTEYGASSRSGAPSLICPNDYNGGKLSKFTVSDVINGNGNLIYKIGLLTIDEVIYAGHISSMHTPVKTYLRENATGYSWWSLSPAVYNDDGGGLMSSVFEVDSDGSVNGSPPGYDYSLRPAISLVSDTAISGGTGTSEDPYIVK
ncbi:MAG: hypothetical protein Q4C33_00925 [bacterium]|nr:hypothetical protein [bacterium]